MWTCWWKPGQNPYSQSFKRSWPLWWCLLGCLGYFLLWSAGISSADNPHFSLFRILLCPAHTLGSHLWKPLSRIMCRCLRACIRQWDPTAYPQARWKCWKVIVTWRHHSVNQESIDSYSQLPPHPSGGIVLRQMSHTISQSSPGGWNSGCPQWQHAW